MATTKAKPVSRPASRPKAKPILIENPGTGNASVVTGLIGTTLLFMGPVVTFLPLMIGGIACFLAWDARRKSPNSKAWTVGFFFGSIAAGVGIFYALIALLWFAG